jgi:uncharacterized protein (DUF1499 family)
MAAPKHQRLTKTKSATAGPLKRAIIIVMVLIAATFGAGQLQLLDLLYAKLVGPPDLGPVAFERLTRRTSGNDALACPPGECGSANVDIRPPTYAETANELRQRVRRYFADKGAVLVGSDDASLHDRFVARTYFFHFPDTVDVAYFPVDANHATLAIYSRSQLGSGDFGTNLRRVRALIEALGPGSASAMIELPRG